jgi:hypothetical protein
VGLEFERQMGADDIPKSIPVAVWLAPSAASIEGEDREIQPLAGARVETRLGGAPVASTATDSTGVWALPRRPEERVAITVWTPTGVFDVLAPAPVVENVLVDVSDTPPQSWPDAALRVSEDDILGDVSVIVEEAHRP